MGLPTLPSCPACEVRLADAGRFPASVRRVDGELAFRGDQTLPVNPELELRGRHPSLRGSPQGISPVVAGDRTVQPLLADRGHVVQQDDRVVRTGHPHALPLVWSKSLTKPQFRALYVQAHEIVLEGRFTHDQRKTVRVYFKRNQSQFWAVLYVLKHGRRYEHLARSFRSTNLKDMKPLVRIDYVRQGKGVPFFTRPLKAIKKQVALEREHWRAEQAEQRTRRRWSPSVPDATLGGGRLRKLPRSRDPGLFTEDLRGPLDAALALDPATDGGYLDMRPGLQQGHPLAADPAGLHRLLSTPGGGPVAVETKPVGERTPTLLPVRALCGQPTPIRDPAV